MLHYLNIKLQLTSILFLKLLCIYNIFIKIFSTYKRLIEVIYEMNAGASY